MYFKQKLNFDWFSIRSLKTQNDKIETLAANAITV